MIRKLRKKLIFVLMAVVCLFLVGILLSMFISSKTNFEQRSFNAFRDPSGFRADTPAQTDGVPDRNVPGDAGAFDMPGALVRVGADGEVTVIQNQIYYVTADELKTIVAGLDSRTESGGLTSEYSLRYRRRTEDDGTRWYFFSDTYVERNSLNAQLLYSVVIGVGAIGLFFIVSMLLSRWMVRPVERAWEKQRQFVADASHELRTPLTVVLSNTDMLIASGTVKDEKNRRRLDNIRAESQRMKGLVEDLLSLARSDAMPALAAPVPVNFSYTVTGATLTLEPTLFDTGRTIDCRLEENLTVPGDGVKLRQLADILLDNAAKYSREGTSIRVRMNAAGKKELLLSVASEGEPLTPEECRNIFERFYRSDQSRGKEKGYGLGLAIAQSIVEEHKGRIWAQSDGVKVNTFFVRLPCVESGAKPESTAGGDLPGA